MRMKRKKSVRMRGKRSHGYGGKKKHRGAGSRGGRGMAGTGKRAAQKKPTILKIYGSSYFGKRGFKRPQKVFKEKKSINLSYFEENAFKFKEENGFIIIDADKLGYDKVLGGGRLTKKFKITCKEFSKSAIQKVNECGGEAVICQ